MLFAFYGGMYYWHCIWFFNTIGQQGHLYYTGVLENCKDSNYWDSNGG